jgi:hypothetical protein
VGDQRRVADLSGHDLDDEQTTLERIYRQTIEGLLTRASSLGSAAPASLPSREPARRAGQAPGPPTRSRDRAPQGPETPSAAAPSPEAPAPGQPWRKPPETASDLANLRALANRHTRQTFDADMRQLALSAGRKLWSALAMILLSQLLFWLSVPVPSLGLGLALATLLVGILWTLQYYRLTGELARKLASRPESDKVGAFQNPMQS